MTINFNVLNTLILNPVDIANYLESTLNTYLTQYKDGVYITGKSQPIIIPGKQYFQLIKKSNGLVTQQPLTSLENIIGDIVDGDGNLILSKKIKKKQLSLEPTMPIRGINIIFQYIEKIVTDHCEWSHNKNRPLQYYLSNYIVNEHKDNEELYSKIDDLLVELKHEVKRFLGDNRWNMVFCKQIGTDIFIENCGDYRIFDWTRRMESKEWI